jgi:hypothetical protein
MAEKAEVVEMRSEKQADAEVGEAAGAGDEQEVEEEHAVTSPLNPPPDLPPPDSPDSEENDEMIRRLDDEVDNQDSVETQDDGDDEPSELGHQQMRDERGQSVLHFAASRPGGAQTIFSFLQNPAVNLAWRDENLKTPRDVAAEVGRVENVMSVDSFVVGLALQGTYLWLHRTD